MKLSSRAGDSLVALISLAIGVLTLALVPKEIAGQTLAAIGDMNSPAFFPIIAALLMTICGATLALRAIARGSTDKEATIEFKRSGSVFTVMAMFVLFAVATHFIGMLVSAVATILVMAWFLNYRNLWVLIPVAVAVPAVIYLLFERVLLILLPRGVLIS